MKRHIWRKDLSDNRDRGFSLIEIIVVIAIMAILVAILAPNITRYISKARRQTDINNGTEIANAAIRVMTADDLVDGKVGGKYMTMLAWNKDAEYSGGTDVYSKIFEDIGSVPKPSYLKDGFFVVRINCSDDKKKGDPTLWTIRNVYLVDRLGDTEGYELYPDGSKFLNNCEKVKIQ